MKLENFLDLHIANPDLCTGPRSTDPFLQDITVASAVCADVSRHCCARVQRRHLYVACPISGNETSRAESALERLTSLNISCD